MTNGKLKIYMNKNNIMLSTFPYIILDVKYYWYVVFLLNNFDKTNNIIIKR